MATPLGSFHGGVQERQTRQGRLRGAKLRNRLFHDVVGRGDGVQARGFRAHVPKLLGDPLCLCGQPRLRSKDVC